MAAYDISDLAHLLSRRPEAGVDPHPLILKLATDLFVARKSHTAHEYLAFAALCAPLIATVDEATAITTATAVCQRTDLPEAILRALIDRGGACAAFVLQHALHADETTLCTMADMTDAGQASAIARRPALSAGLALILAEHPDAGVVRTLGENPAVALEPDLEARLCERAETDPGLAEVLAARRDLSPGQRAKLFLQAGAITRRRIVAEIAALARLDPPRRFRAMAADLAAIDEAACAGDSAAMTGILSRLLRLPVLQAQNLVADEGGEALIVALKAIDCPEEIVVRLLIRLDPALGASVARVFGLVEFFRSLETRTALRLLASFTDASFGEADLAAHQPASDPAVRPERRAGLAADAGSRAEQTRSLIERAIGRKGS